MTLNGFLGASYCLSAAFEGISLFGMCLIYYFIWKNEKKHGPLGERDELEHENVFENNNETRRESMVSSESSVDLT